MGRLSGLPVATLRRAIATRGRPGSAVTAGGRAVRICRSSRSCRGRTVRVGLTVGVEAAAACVSHHRSAERVDRSMRRGCRRLSGRRSVSRGWCAEALARRRAITLRGRGRCARRRTEALLRNSPGGRAKVGTTGGRTETLRGRGRRAKTGGRSGWGSRRRSVSTDRRRSDPEHRPLQLRARSGDRCAGRWGSGGWRSGRCVSGRRARSCCRRRTGGRGGRLGHHRRVHHEHRALELRGCRTL